MNVEDPAVIKAAVDQLHAAADEVVDRLNAALTVNLNSALLRSDIMLGRGADVIRAILAGTVVDLQTTIKSLDGWTMDIGPITIPPFTIRLSKPKEP